MALPSGASRLQGQRYSRWSGGTRTVAALAAVAATGGAVWYVYTGTTQLGRPVKDVCDVRNAVVSASKTARDGVDAAGAPVSYAPGNLIDGDIATAWRTPGRGVGRIVTLTFKDTCRLLRMDIVNGYEKVDERSRIDRWRQNRRVSVAVVRFDDGSKLKVRLKSNKRGWQKIELPPAAVRSLRIEIVESRRSKSTRDYTAISEIRTS